MVRSASNSLSGISRAPGSGIIEAMCAQPAPVAAGHHLQRSRFHRRVVQREPHGEHVGVVGLGRHDAVILVPAGGADYRSAVRGGGQLPLRRLDAHVLHRVGVDLRSDQRLHHVQQRFGGKRVQHRRAEPERRVRSHAGEGQGEVEVLGMAAPALRVDARHPRPERQLGPGRGNLAGGEQVCRQAVEHRLVLGDHRIETGLRIQHSRHLEIALLPELIHLRRAQCTHRLPPARRFIRDCMDIRRAAQHLDRGRPGNA